ncbi:MAG: hypothetical protein HYR91_13075 [Flavobacteriia bacterium]|nr:hypothetical protein [Flavobacteriia bacterium]
MERSSIQSIKLTFLFLMLYSCLTTKEALGQVDFFFLKHLSENQLKKEHFTYLEKVNTSEDSIFYFKAKYYLQYEEDSLFFIAFKKSKILFLKDSNALNFASRYFIVNENRELWFNEIDSMTLPKITDNILLFHKLIMKPNKNFDLPKSFKLSEKYLCYLKAESKNPKIAFMLSVVPGLGEVYIGNWKSFLIKFTSQSILIAQTLESNRNLGPYKPLTIINFGFFSGFYFSGFIGAYRDTIQKKKDTQNDFLFHAKNYINSIYHFSLY